MRFVPLLCAALAFFTCAAVAQGHATAPASAAVPTTSSAACTTPPKDDPISVCLKTFKVVNGTSGEKLVPATTLAEPMEYVATYTNRSKSATGEVRAVIKVPDGLVFMGVAKPNMYEASVDGATFAGAPLTREVVVKGKKSTQVVPPNQYRALRWTIPSIAAGRTAEVTMRVQPAAGQVAKK